MDPVNSSPTVGGMPNPTIDSPRKQRRIRSKDATIGAPGLTTRNKELLGAPGIATRSKDATRVEVIAFLLMVVSVSYPTIFLLFLCNTREKVSGWASSPPSACKVLGDVQGKETNHWRLNMRISMRQIFSWPPNLQVALP